MTTATTDAARLLRAASFAASRHTGQVRKGADRAPYINHPLDVADMLAGAGGVTDVDVLVAALLHDTVEDTGVSLNQVEEDFGARVRSLVAEVTDDKSLPSAERKQKQIEHAPHLTEGAKRIKLADKISNVRDVGAHPPADWPLERKLDYLDWAERVVAGLRGTSPELEARFDAVLAESRASISAS